MNNDFITDVLYIQKQYSSMYVHSFIIKKTDDSNGSLHALVKDYPDNKFKEMIFDVDLDEIHFRYKLCIKSLIRKKLNEENYL